MKCEVRHATLSNSAGFKMFYLSAKVVTHKVVENKLPLDLTENFSAMLGGSSMACWLRGREIEMALRL